MFDRLGDRGPNFLFVAAAGNAGRALGELRPGSQQIHQHFPASYGGPDNDGQANLIAIAALYRDGATGWKRAPFSDFGTNHVELGAPGCAVPVVHYERDQEAWESVPHRENGTSFAAPLVSFTAALISNEKPDLSGSQIKNRLLAAADLNPSLAREIIDGRSLNVVKAASLVQDVLQTGSQILRGTMQVMHVGRGVPLQAAEIFQLPAMAFRTET